MFGKVKGEYLCTEDLNSNTIQAFFEGVGLIEKQNRDGLIGNCGFDIAALNKTISDKA